MNEDKTCKTSRWRMLKSQLNNLSTKEFAETVNSTKDAVIIDVRTEPEYQLGHIPNAINLDYLSDEFWSQVEKLDANNIHFIYCRSGRRSIRVCTLMRNGGFNNKMLFNLDKGFNDWKEEFPDIVNSL